MTRCRPLAAPHRRYRVGDRPYPRLPLSHFGRPLPVARTSPVPPHVRVVGATAGSDPDLLVVRDTRTSHVRVAGTTARPDVAPKALALLRPYAHGGELRLLH